MMAQQSPAPYSEKLHFSEPERLTLCQRMEIKMTPWKHRLLAYAILVLLFSSGLVGLQRIVLRKSHEQVAGKPALVEIQAIANANDLAPEIIRGALEADVAPTNNPALSQIWSLAKDNRISKYEVSFYLDPKERKPLTGFHRIVFSQAISVGFIIGAYGIVYAIVGAFFGTKTSKKTNKKAKRAQQCT